MVLDSKAPPSTLNPAAPPLAPVPTHAFTGGTATRPTHLRDLFNSADVVEAPELGSTAKAGGDAKSDSDDDRDPAVASNGRWMRRTTVRNPRSDRSYRISLRWSKRERERCTEKQRDAQKEKQERGKKEAKQEESESESESDKLDYKL
jgi:hypothetical protein